MESSSKKRERPPESDARDDSTQQPKRTLYNSFTSLKIASNSNPSNPDIDIDEIEAGMEPEGDLVADHSTMDTDNGGATPPSPYVDTDEYDSDMDNMNTLQLHRSMESDNLLSVLKNGTRKYGRRVDYLVDELIRKSQKIQRSSADQITDLDYEQIVPSSIGPHPLADRALGKLWPTVVPTTEGAALLRLAYETRACADGKGTNSVNDSDSCMDEDCQETDSSKDMNVSESGTELNGIIEEYEHVSIDSGLQSEQACQGRANNLANNITHRDWGIEEVGDLA